MKKRIFTSFALSLLLAGACMPAMAQSAGYEKIPNSSAMGGWADDSHQYYVEYEVAYNFTNLTFEIVKFVSLQRYNASNDSFTEVGAEEPGQVRIVFSSDIGSSVEGDTNTYTLASIADEAFTNLPLAVTEMDFSAGKIDNIGQKAFQYLHNGDNDPELKLTFGLAKNTLVKEYAFEYSKVNINAVYNNVQSPAITLNEGVFIMTKAQLNNTFMQSLSDIGAFAFYGSTILNQGSPYKISQSTTPNLKNIYSSAFKLSNIAEYEHVLGCECDSYNGNQLSFCHNLEKIDLSNLQAQDQWNSETPAIVPISFADHCSNLTSITFAPTNYYIKPAAFANCPKLEKLLRNTNYSTPECYLRVGANAFENCKKLNLEYRNTSTEIRPYINSADDSAFKNCESLTEVHSEPAYSSSTIPADVFFGNYAFANCTSLEQAGINSGDHILREGTFSGCTNLVSATLYGFNEIQKEAFKGAGTNVASPSATGLHIFAYYPIEVFGEDAFADSGIVELSQNICNPDYLEAHPGVTAANYIDQWAQYSFANINANPMWKRAAINIPVLKEGVAADANPASNADWYNIFETSQAEYANENRLSRISATSISDYAFAGMDNPNGGIDLANATHIGKRAFSSARLAVLMLHPEFKVTFDEEAFHSNFIQAIWFPEPKTLDQWCSNYTFADCWANPFGHVKNENQIHQSFAPDGTVVNGFSIDEGTCHALHVDVPDYAFYHFKLDSPVILSDGVKKIGKEAFAYAEIGHYYDPAGDGSSMPYIIANTATPPEAYDDSFFKNKTWAIQTNSFEQYKAFTANENWSPRDFLYINDFNVPTLTGFQLDYHLPFYNQCHPYYIRVGQAVQLEASDFQWIVPDGVAEPTDEEAAANITLKCVTDEGYRDIASCTPSGYVSINGMGAPDDYGKYESVRVSYDGISVDIPMQHAIINVEADYTLGLSEAGSEIELNVIDVPEDFAIRAWQGEFQGVGYPKEEVNQGVANALFSALGETTQNYGENQKACEEAAYGKFYTYLYHYMNVFPTEPEVDTPYHVIAEFPDGKKYYVTAAATTNAAISYDVKLVAVDEATASDMANATMTFHAIPNSQSGRTMTTVVNGETVYFYPINHCFAKESSSRKPNIYFRNAGADLNPGTELDGDKTLWTPDFNLFGKFTLEGSDSERPSLLFSPLSGVTCYTSKAYIKNYTSLISIVPANADPYAPRIKGDANGDGQVSIEDITTVTNALLNQNQ